MVERGAAMEKFGNVRDDLLENIAVKEIERSTSRTAR